MNYSGIKCWYCGEQAESQDHFAPVGSKGGRKARKKAMKQFSRLTVPACNRCNSLKGILSVEDFRQEIIACPEITKCFRPRQARINRVAVLLKPWGMKFYGERAVDGVFPLVGQAQPFKFKWKAKAPRNTGAQAVRIEECAKRGEYNEVQGGLANGE